MADAIVIKIKLDPQDIPATGKEIARQLSGALNSSAASAKESGRKIANALNAGVDEGLKRARETAKKLNEVLSSTKRHLTEEEKERAHQRRMEVLQARTIADESRTATKLQEIEAKKQAQIDVIRERATQRQVEQQRRLERAAQAGAGGFQVFLRRYSSTIREAGESLQQAGYAALSITSAIVGVGTAAVRSAIELDKQVNVLKALSGSADIAEKRLSELIALSQKTPGLTTTLAATLDAQLRVASVTEQTINRILPAIGRLNAISPVDDPKQFARNLVQIGTSFDKQDIKELVEKSAFSGELIKQLFNVNSSTNAEAIRASAKKLGITTVEQFIAAFADAAQNNPKLANVTESLGTQIEKLQDRIAVALRPLGLAILDSIVPALESVTPAIENLIGTFTALDAPTKTFIVMFGGIVAVIAPVVIALGAIIQSFGAIASLIPVIKATGIAISGAFVTTQAAILAANPLLLAFIAALGVAAYAWMSYKSAAQLAAEITTESIRKQGEQLKQNQELTQAINNLNGPVKESGERHRDLEIILGRLDPLTKAYIVSIKDEKDKIRELNIEIQKRTKESKESLENQFRVLVSGAAETINQMGGVERKLGGLREAINEAVADNAGKTGFYADIVRNQIRGTSQDVSENEKRYSDLQKTLADTQIKYLLIADSLRLNRDEFRALVSSVISNKDQLNVLIVAYDLYKQKQADAGKSTSNTTLQIDRQAEAIKNLQNALKNFNVQGIKEGVDAHLDIIAKEAKTPAEARRRLQELRQKDSSVDEGIRKTQRFEKNRQTLEDVVSGGQRVARDTSKAEKTADLLEDARQRRDDSGRENTLRLLKDTNDAKLKEYERYYSINTKTADEFYKQKLALLQSTTTAEINSLNERLKYEQAGFDKAKKGSKERIEFEEKIGKTETEIELKRRELARLGPQLAQEAADAKKRIAEAVEQLDRTTIEAEISLRIDANNRIIEDYQRLHDTGKIGAEEFYNKKIELIRNSANEEIEYITTQIKARERELKDYKEGTEKRIELETLLARLRGDLTVKTRDLKDAEKAVNDERRKTAIGLENQIKNLREELKDLNDPEVTQLRREKAGVEAQAEGVRAQRDAEESIIKSRAKIADASIYHADRANSIFLDHLARQQSVTEAVADSMIKAYEGVASSLDRGIDKMTKKLGAFGEFVNGIFKAVARNILATLTAPQQGGGQQSASGGGFLGALGNIFRGGSGGGVFGTGGAGGTPPFNPNGFAAGGVGGSGGLNLTSISRLTSFLTPQSASGGSVSGGGSGGGSIFANPGQFIKSNPLFLPIAGGLLGSSLGGKSTLGKILGGVGGGVIGLGATFAAGGFASSTALAALFSNPFTIPLAIGAIVGAVFLGKAKQRGKDEAAAGVYEREVDAAIHKLKDAINRDEVQGYDQAKEIFENQILANYRNQIGQLKTKSVRDSRLTNQVRDLTGTFENVIRPAVDDQIKRRDMEAQRKLLSGLLIPEFAVGGIVPGMLGSPQMILAHGGEMVINPQQQTPSLMQAAWGAGVPGAQGSSNASQESQQPISISVTVTLGTETQDKLFVNGAKSGSGFNAIVGTIQKALDFKDLRFQGA